MLRRPRRKTARLERPRKPDQPAGICPSGILVAVESQEQRGSEFLVVFIEVFEILVG